MNRHVGTLAVIAVMACFAVIGAVGGTYLANRTASGGTDRTVSAGPGAGPTPAGSEAAVPDPTGSSGSSPEPSRSSEPPKPSGSESPAPPEPSRSAGQTRAGKYQIDRTLYDALSMSVTLTSAEVTGGKLKLNLRYRNDSLIPWPLTCPTVEVDRNSSRIDLGNGRTVRPESTWCAATRAGESFNLAPGAQASTWAVFPAVPATGTSFDLTWYDFPVLEDVRLR